jgi:hypothetical protein
MPEQLNPQPGDAGSGLSRRTILKGAAWSVPVIAIGSAAPAMAATCIPTITLGPRSCKCPGQANVLPWTYFLEVCADGTACPQSTATLVITEIISNSGVTVYTGPSDPITVGECVVIQGSSSNSANFLDIYYTVNGVPAPSPTRVNAPPDCDDVQDAIGDCNPPL